MPRTAFLNLQPKAHRLRRSIMLRFLDRLSIHSRRSLVAYHLEQRLCQIGDRRHLFEQPTGVGRIGDGSCRSLALCRMQQKGAPAGCVRRASLPVPLRAVGESKAQLTGTRASQSISPFAPPAFTARLETVKLLVARGAPLEAVN